MIRLDHMHVLSTFHQYEIDTPPRVKKGLVDTICVSIEIHSQLEEEIFYPALRAVAETEIVRKSMPEHHQMRQLITQLRNLEPTDATYDETFFQLMNVVMHHVADEETLLLPTAERVLADRLGELGAEMTKRRMQLAVPAQRRDRRRYGAFDEHGDPAGRRGDAARGWLPDDAARLQGSSLAGPQGVSADSLRPRCV